MAKIVRYNGGTQSYYGCTEPNALVVGKEYEVIAAKDRGWQTDYTLKGVSGSASPHINVGDIKAFKMIMPPIELQEQFSDFVKQVDKSKVVVKQAHDKAQLLFDSLMQKYFG